MVKEYNQTTGNILPFKAPSTQAEYDSMSEKDREVYENKCNLYEDLIDEEVTELIDCKNPEEMLKEGADVVYVVMGMFATLGYDFDEVFKRVHENNMGRMTQNDGSILRDKNGKIIKNPDYPKVFLGDLV